MIEKFFLERNNTVMVIIDIQEKLSSKMEYRDSVLNNTIKLINACKILNIPIIVTEQYPKGIGQTEKEIIEHLPEYNPILKMTFSCYGEKNFRDALKEIKKPNIILVGIESPCMRIANSSGLYKSRLQCACNKRCHMFKRKR